MSEERPLINQIKSSIIEIEGRVYHPPQTNDKSPYVEIEQDDVSTTTANYFQPINEILIEKISEKDEIDKVEDINKIYGSEVIKFQESKNNSDKKLNKKEIFDLSALPVVNINNQDTGINYQADLKEISVKLEELIADNFSYFIQYNPFFQDHEMFMYLKISNFKKFLEEEREYETEFIEIINSKWNIKLFCKGIIIPNKEKENFSIKLEFTDDNTNSTVNQSFYETKQVNISNISQFSNKDKKSLKKNSDEYTLLGGEKEDEEWSPSDKKKNVFGKKKAKTKTKDGKDSDNKNNNLNENNSSNYLQIFSKSLQKILAKNQIDFNYVCSLFDKNSRYNYSNQNKGTINLNKTNILHLEDIKEYQDLLYEGLIDPLIVKIRLEFPTEYLDKKCDDFQGIYNEGNTCYSNTVLQCLYHLPFIRKAIYSIPSEELTPLFQIQKIFYLLQTEKRKYAPVKTPELFQSLKWEKSYWNSQQDAQEFFSLIFDLLSENEKTIMGQDAIISAKCEGVIESTIECVDIKKKSSKKENFHFLQLDLENCSDLIECIEKYISVENMSGDNQYEADDGNKYNATRSFSFEKIPEILFVHLKRFKFNPYSNSMDKVHTRISYQNIIDLSSYYTTKSNDVKHSLYAVIVHEGQIDKGHYYVFIKDFKNKRWIKFNDTNVSVVSEDEVFSQNFGGEETEVIVTKNGDILSCKNDRLRTAYMLIYVQKNKIKELFNVVDIKDIPESLLEIISPPVIKKGRTTLNSMNTFNNISNGGLKGVNYSESPIRNSIGFNNTKLNFVGKGPSYPPNKLSRKYDVVNTVFGPQSNNENTNTDKSPYPNINSLDQFSALLKVGTGYVSKGKVKNKDRSVSKEKKQAEQKRSKDINNNKMITQILHNKPDSKSPDIEIIIPPEINLETYTNNTTMPLSTTNTSKINMKKYVSNNKNLLRTFQMVFVNQNSKFLEEVKISTTLEKKLCCSFIEDCVNQLKKKIDMINIKLVLLSNMGIFIRILEDFEEIQDILLDHKNKKNQLLFYVFEDPVALNDNYTVALHLLPDKFTEKVEVVNVHNKSGNIPLIPVILKDNKMVENEDNFRNTIYRMLIENFYVPMTECKNVPISFIENSGENLISLEKFTQIKTAKLDQYNFLTKCTNLSKSSTVIRIALESSEYFKP